MLKVDGLMAGSSFILTVTDVKQFLYCPRIVYFTYCMPVRRPLTYKMVEGEKQHDETADRERRRTLKAYGLSEGERFFDVHLRSERLGLGGLLDMVIRTAREVIPVEFKHSMAAPGLNHKYQLTAYALLVEDEWERPVRRSFVYLIPLKRSQEVPITSGMRTFVVTALEKMRTMIDHETMPPGTRQRGRCVDCEFRRYCGDR